MGNDYCHCIFIAFSLGVSRGRIMIIVIAFLLVIGRGG